MTVVAYKPPGAVAEAFLQDPNFVVGIMGPVGSGKSSVSIWKAMLNSLSVQQPFNGIRKSRGAVLRNHYPELKTTTIKSWQDWFPPQVCTIKWDTPITAKINLPDIGDGTGVEIEVFFIAMDRPEEVGKLKSLELTWAWVNEASEVPQEIVQMLTQRVGRFPAQREGGPTRPQVILDYNPPDDDHWLYLMAEEQAPKGWSFYRQPGAMVRTEEGLWTPNPTAENVLNIPGGYTYYERMIAGKDDEWINVFVSGNYGRTIIGKAVYPEWKDIVHTAKEEIKPVAGNPIYLGWDYGLTPSCIIGQISPRGQLMILDELVAEDMGIRQFAREVVRPYLANNFPSYRIISTGDPAGTQRAQTDEKTCQQELLEVGIPTESAPTNSFVARRESVAFFLRGMSGGSPAFQLSPKCRVLRKGFNGGYSYSKLRVGGGNALYKDRPDKNAYSHPHDALQYLCLKIRESMNPVRARAVVTKSAVGWT